MEAPIAPENSGDNSGDQIRRDIAHHGNAFVLDGRRLDPALVAVHEARCPDCGSLDADLSHGPPLTAGVKCWDCGRVYRVEESGPA